MPPVWKTIVEQISIEVDPNDLEKTFKKLQDQAKRLAQDGMQSKVRIKYKGNQICPDIPLGVFVAAEFASVMYLGPLRSFIVNLGVKAFIEIEIIHEIKEKLQAGQDAFADGDIEKAEKIYRQLLEQVPQDPYVNYYLGIVLRAQGKKTEARLHLLNAATTESFEFAQKAQEIVDKMDGIVKNI